MKRLSAVLALMLPISCGPAADPRVHTVSVEANPHGHEATPVSVTLELPAAMDGPVCITGEGGERPGQIERLSETHARVWWTVDLPASGSGSFTIDVGRDCSQGAFSWRSASEDATDLVFMGRPFLQYVHPRFDPEDIEHTKKPFHHVYNREGTRTITKGPGGLYSHHRGIYFGYNHIYIGDSEERIDTWHANDGEHQQHVEEVSTYEGPVFGGHAVRIHWNDREGNPFVEEIREVRAFHQPDGRILIDFRSNLRSLVGPVRLGGDRQHAGVQFRASQDVAENREATRFLRSEAWADRPQDEEVNDDQHVDLPWNAMIFPLDGVNYTVAYLSHPSNPRNAEMSERKYGRFGEFFRHELDETRSLEAQYRFWIVPETTVSREDVERRFQDMAEPPSVRR